MEICQTLKTAIDTVDLSTEDKRCGATAMSIVLLEKIHSAELDECKRCEHYPPCDIIYKDYNYEKCLINDSEHRCIDDMWVLNIASSTLYYAYSLGLYEHYGIRAHIYKDNKYGSSLK